MRGSSRTSRFRSCSEAQLICQRVMKLCRGGWVEEEEEGEVDNFMSGQV